MEEVVTTSVAPVKEEAPPPQPGQTITPYEADQIKRALIDALIAHPGAKMEEMAASMLRAYLIVKAFTS